MASVGSALLVNLGLQSRIPSLVTLLAVGVVSAAIAGRPARRRPGVIAALGLAVGAASILVIRTSLWVVVPASLVAGASLIVASQDRLVTRSGRLATAFNYGTDVFNSVRWLLKPAVGLTVGGTRQHRLLRGVGLATVVVIPLGALLASADPIFGRVLSQGVGQGLWTHIATTMLLLPLTAGLVLGSRRDDRPDRGSMTGGAKPGSMVEGAMVLGAVALLLGAWGLTQIVVAAGGAERLLETVNLTAAQHARQGFFQLVAVVGLLVLVVIGVDRYVERTDRVQRLWFLGLTSLIGLETLGLVVATYSRLSLYINGFGQTMLRTAVAWFLAWLAVAMIVVIVAMNRSSSSHHFVGAGLFVLAGVWVIAFGASNPEATVARGNLERSDTVALDPAYLTDRLGPDAVPVIVEMLPTQPPETRDLIRTGLCQRIDEFGGEGGLTGWNRSNSRARSTMAGLDCR